MIAAAATDRGRARTNNEDSVFADAARGILIVADGMGGHLGGEVASRLAVEVISANLLSAPPQLEPSRLLAEALDAANLAIWQTAAADSSLTGMGTTVAVVLVRDDELWLAHAGDSRIYLFRQGRLERLTRDHTLVEQMVEAGELTPEQARVHPLRNVISRCLGTEPTAEPEIRKATWKQGDSVLLCSDGLTGMLEDEEIAQVLSEQKAPPDALCRKLIDLANERGGWDNISVVLARHTG